MICAPVLMFQSFNNGKINTYYCRLKVQERVIFTVISAFKIIHYSTPKEEESGVLIMFKTDLK